jgi:8-oxo-dGTP pyrophosphatase MutT (NUDIX family)
VVRELAEELKLELKEALEAPLMLTISETVGLTAGHTDVSLWYVLNGDRHAPVEFDAEEFYSARWFHVDEAPISRSDPHLSRFLRKLAGSSRGK